MARECIKKKEKENIYAKEITSDPNKLKRFLVSAPLQSKAELYDPKFCLRMVDIKIYFM